MDNKISDSLKELSRRVDTLQKSVDIVNNDRNLLEDILSRLSAVEQALHLNKANQMEVKKDLKADIQEVKHSVEDKVDEVRLGIEDKTVIIHNVTENIITKIKRKLGGE